MAPKRVSDPAEGVLTNPMDTGSDGFKEFQAIMLNRSRERTEEQKLEIELIALRLKMEAYLDSEDEKIEAAGVFLKKFLKILQIPQKRFAEYIGRRPSNLSKMISGERPINHEQALILGTIFNIDPMLWIRIQSKNEIKKLLASKNKNYRKYSLNDLI